MPTSPFINPSPVKLIEIKTPAGASEAQRAEQSRLKTVVEGADRYSPPALAVAAFVCCRADCPSRPCTDLNPKPISSPG
jgi:hypothetical protein